MSLGLKASFFSEGDDNTDIDMATLEKLAQHSSSYLSQKAAKLGITDESADKMAVDASDDKESSENNDSSDDSSSSDDDAEELVKPAAAAVAAVPETRKRKREATASTTEKLAVTPGFVWGAVTSLPNSLLQGHESSSDDDAGHGSDEDDDNDGGASLLHMCSRFIKKNHLQK